MKYHVVNQNENPEGKLNNESRGLNETLERLSPGIVRQTYFVTREELNPGNSLGNLDVSITDALVRRAGELPQLTELKEHIDQRLALDVHAEGLELHAKVTPQISGLPSADFVWHARLGSNDIVVVGDVKGKGMSRYPEHGISADIAESDLDRPLSEFSFSPSGSEEPLSEEVVEGSELIERQLCGDFSGALMVVKSFDLLDRTLRSVDQSSNKLDSKDGAAVFLRELGRQFYHEDNCPQESKDIAVTVLVYDSETGNGSVVSAGGAPLVVARPNDTGDVELESKGAMLASIEVLGWTGAFDDPGTIRAEEVKLKGADAFICTDGYLDTPRAFLDPLSLAELLTPISECNLDEFHRKFCERYVRDSSGRTGLGRLARDCPSNADAQSDAAGQGQIPEVLPDDSLICIMSFR